MKILCEADWRLARSGLALLVALVAAARLSAASRDEFLEVIHAVENPRDLARPGRHGELGAYQFRPGTWRMHTREPFQRALDRGASDEVAVRHYEWLRRGLLRHGQAPSAYNLALAWNGGLAATVRGRAPAAARNYARRVINLLAAGGGHGLASAR